MEASESKGAPRAVLALPAVALVLVAIWEITATLRAPGGVPDDDAFAQAGSYVREHMQPGDLVVFAPAWIDPVGRMVVGNALTVDAAARMDSAKYARIWELSIRDEHAPEVAKLRPEEALDIGGVAVSRYQQPPVTVLADLRDRMDTAKIVGGAAHVELQEVGFAPHRCILATPFSDQHPIAITFPGVTLGSQIVGYVGIADVFTRRDRREPASLSLSFGELAHPAVTAIAGVDDGWVRFSATTPPGTVANLTFQLASAAGGRLICFAAEVRQ
ncbi:MAG TPA: hypothetical protein VGM90_07190 [Kofleriaceae bacterium]|jgi:hypothetical protein